MNNDQEKLKQTAKRLGLTLKQMPRHIAIIMDGNGRWAKRRNLPRVEGHRRGAQTAEKIAQCCVDLGIESLTLYSYSMENWSRPKAEVDALMHLHTQYLIGIRPNLIKNNVKLRHFGRLAGLPSAVKKELLKTISVTSKNTGMVLGLALNYGGRAEITDAARQIALKYKKGQLRLKDIDELCISRHLYTGSEGSGVRGQKSQSPNPEPRSLIPDPDLLIRTANEMRISNFLLWQISYSEFYVTKTLWPDFKKANLEKAILAYSKRDRRFGSIQSAKCKIKEVIAP